MGGTGVATQDFLLLNRVVAMTICSTRLNDVIVVDATADRVAFGDSDTHDGDVVVRDRCFSIN